MESLGTIIANDNSPSTTEYFTVTENPVVDFTASHNITASAGSNGTISPASQNVLHGGTAIFIAHPNPGYYTCSCTGGTLSGDTVSVSNVTDDRSVSVNFCQSVCSISGHVFGFNGIGE